jgi:hypothetical protein
MESVLDSEVSKVKNTFEIYRKELERQEQTLLRELYNRYSEHLGRLRTSCGEQEVQGLKQKLDSAIN